MVSQLLWFAKEKMLTTLMQNVNWRHWM